MYVAKNIYHLHDIITYSIINLDFYKDIPAILETKNPFHSLPTIMANFLFEVRSNRNYNAHIMMIRYHTIPIIKFSCREQQFLHFFRKHKERLFSNQNIIKISKLSSASNCQSKKKQSDIQTKHRIFLCWLICRGFYENVV